MPSSLTQVLMTFYIPIHIFDESHEGQARESALPEAQESKLDTASVCKQYSTRCMLLLFQDTFSTGWAAFEIYSQSFVGCLHIDH